MRLRVKHILFIKTSKLIVSLKSNVLNHQKFKKLNSKILKNKMPIHSLYNSCTTNSNQFSLTSHRLFFNYLKKVRLLFLHFLFFKYNILLINLEIIPNFLIEKNFKSKIIKIIIKINHW